MKGKRTRSVGTLTKGFGLRLKKLRESRGLSQKQLSDLIGADVVQISRYERAQVLPALETAAALAHILRVSADELWLGVDATKPQQEEPPIGNLRLYQRFREAEALPLKDREAIILLVDGVLAQRNIEAQIDKRRRA
ncbi:MAG: helix-turn-helix transcriptional regulator [Thermoanaerobaculia bacterium]